jgi:hypothetical protein
MVIILYSYFFCWTPLISTTLSDQVKLDSNNEPIVGVSLFFFASFIQIF